MRLSILFATIALIAQTGPQPGGAVERAASPPPRDIQQSLDFVPTRMAHDHVPGLSLAFIHNGTVEWNQVFGIARGGEPVTPETLFQAGPSMPLTAVAVLRLVEQGRLNLDADVRLYLRSWKIPANRFTEQKKVTLRELLSHTAGVPFAGYKGYLAGEKVPTLVQVLNGAGPANSGPVTIDRVPGTAFQYATGDYLIIQRILMDVTGEPFPDLMRELVLQPLRMVHSTFQQPIPEKLQPMMAMPYDNNGNAIEGGPHIYPEMAVAGLWTTPSDLALFGLAVQDALSGRPGAILSPSTAREMLQPVPQAQRLELGFYALGFSIAGKGANRYFSHPGATSGFLAFFFIYEKGDGVVLMANSQHSKALMLEVIQTLAKQYGWTEFPTAQSRLGNPWVIGLICACIVLLTYFLLRVARHRKKPNERRRVAFISPASC